MEKKRVRDFVMDLLQDNSVAVVFSERPNGFDLSVTTLDCGFCEPEGLKVSPDELELSETAKKTFESFLEKRGKTGR